VKITNNNNNNNNNLVGVCVLLSRQVVIKDHYTASWTLAVPPLVLTTDEQTVGLRQLNMTR